MKKLENTLIDGSDIIKSTQREISLDTLINASVVELKRRYGEDIMSIIALGSRVAGFASENSDLDMHVVLESDVNLHYYSFDIGNIEVNALIMPAEDFETRVLDIIKNPGMRTAPFFSPSKTIVGHKYIDETGFEGKKQTMVKFFQEFEKLAGIPPMDYEIYVSLSSIVQWPVLKVSLVNPVVFDRLLKAEKKGKLNSWVQYQIDGYREIIEYFQNEGILTLVNNDPNPIFKYNGERKKGMKPDLIIKQTLEMAISATNYSMRNAKRATRFFLAKRKEQIRNHAFQFFIRLPLYYSYVIRSYYPMYKEYLKNYFNFDLDEKEKSAVYAGLTMENFVITSDRHKEVINKRYNLKRNLVAMLRK